MDPILLRPSGDDTEEDLLRYQQEFLAAKSKPSAKVVRSGDKRKTSDGKVQEGDNEEATTSAARDVVTIPGLPSVFTHTTTAPPVKKSKFKEQASARKQKTETTSAEAEDVLEKHDTHVSKILSEIVERDIQNAPVYFPSFPAQHGFPDVLHRGSQGQAQQPDGKGRKKKSLFAQQFARSSPEQFGISTKERETVAMVSATQQAVSDVVMEHTHDQGRTDSRRLPSAAPLTHALKKTEAHNIHDENVTKMAAMSETEILEEQKKLLEMLDPSLVQFVKSRKAKKGISAAGGASEKMDTDNSEVTVMKTDKQSSTTDAELPIKPKKSWVHMDKVEYDKLSWMNDLPAPTAPDPKTGQPARFDFQGHLVAADADIPTHLGLHHHGDEPERAGYSLAELFQLARSANMQQRVMALKCVSCVIHNARHGEFHESLSAPIIPSLLDGGLIFIVRWALDDSTENSMAAAVQTLHSLLVCQTDENSMDLVFNWYCGQEMPELVSQVAETEEQEESGEKAEKTEADVLKQDVIKGLIRMSLLARLRYILEVWRPSATIVIHILEILTRIARHSTQAAYEVYQCPRLLDTLFKEFLPTTWSPPDVSQQLTSVYGLPVPAALKVVRVICTAGRNMAANIVSKYRLMDVITRFITQDPSQLQLHQDQADSLFLESFYSWQVCVCYGIATEQFGDLYSILMTQMQSASSLTPQSESELVRRCCALIGVLETVTHAAAFSSIDSPSRESKERHAPPAVNWSQVTGLQQPIEMHLCKCLEEFRTCYFEKKYDLSFTASCLNYLATVFSHCSQQPGYNAVETLEHIEQLCERVIIPLLKSQAFTLTLQSLREYSVLLQTVPERKEAATNLPELGSLLGAKADQCPALHPQATVHFLLALVRLLYHMGKLHKGVADQILSPLLEHEELLQYIRKLCRFKKTPLASNYYARFENLFQYYLVKMAQIKSCTDMKLYHQIALLLMTHLHQGDEHLAHDLLSTVIFNQDFLRDVESEESSMTVIQEKLQLEERQHISSATQQVTESASGAELIKDTCTNLADIRASYLTALASLRAQLHRSRARYLHDPLHTDRLLTGAVGQLLVPVDWPFLPLVELYNRSSELNIHQAQETSVPRHVIAMVTSTLRWSHLLERWRSTTLESVSLATKFSRLMCTFLSGSDLFLDPVVHMYLEAVLRMYCRPELLSKMDFEQPIPGLFCFYDLFMLLLAQYEAVSFGDSLFGSYVLLPLQQQHSVLLRRAVWGEHATVLRSLLIPIKEVPIPLERFLEPEEQHLELLRLYFQALFSEAVTPRWCPLPYLIAVHHVNRFFYTQDRGQHGKLRQAMIQQIMKSTNQSLKKHLLYYKKADKTCENGLDLYEELPQIRQDTLSQASKSKS